MTDLIARKLKMLGMLLFLIGLITGLLIMNLKNPRMGLSAHLEGVMNGTFLVIAGFVWAELKLSATIKRLLLWSLIYGTFANWLFTLLSAVFGTSEMTPVIGEGYLGTEIQETIVSGGLVTIAITMIFSLVVLVYGLRGRLSQD